LLSYYQTKKRDNQTISEKKLLKDWKPANLLRRRRLFS